LTGAGLTERRGGARSGGLSAGNGLEFRFEAAIARGRLGSFVGSERLSAALRDAAAWLTTLREGGTSGGVPLRLEEPKILCEIGWTLVTCCADSYIETCAENSSLFLSFAVFCAGDDDDDDDDDVRLTEGCRQCEKNRDGANGDFARSDWDALVSAVAS